jgi:hypothetical protein
VLTTTNKRLLIWESWRFKSMYTMQRKLDQHITHILRSVHVWSSTIRISRGPHIATFHESLTGLDICTILEKKCSRLHLSAQLSGPRDPPQFLFQHNHWTGALNSSTCWWQATRLAGLISPTCDQYVQYLPTGANPSVLNRHRWGATTLEVLAYHISLPDLPNRRSSTFHQRTRPVSSYKFNTNWTRDGTNLKSRKWELPLDFYRKLSSKHSMS